MRGLYYIEVAYLGDEEFSRFYRTPTVVHGQWVDFGERPPRPNPVFVPRTTQSCLTTHPRDAYRRINFSADCWDLGYGLSGMAFQAIGRLESYDEMV